MHYTRQHKAQLETALSTSVHYTLDAVTRPVSCVRL